MSDSQKLLIVTGDDMGLNSNINYGIEIAYRKGILTTASLLANGEKFEEAVKIIKRNKLLSIALHLTIFEGKPVQSLDRVPTLLERDGHFSSTYQELFKKFVRNQLKLTEVDDEFKAQILKVKKSGISIYCLNAHLHIHLHPRIFPVVLKLAHQFEIPSIRHLYEPWYFGKDLIPTLKPLSLIKRLVFPPLSFKTRRKIDYSHINRNDFVLGIYCSGGLCKKYLMGMLPSVNPGITELICHPSLKDEIMCTGEKYSGFEELQVLTDSEIKRKIENIGIQLTTYDNV